MLKTESIYPVLCRVPASEQKLTGREKVAFLSEFARKALCVSASKSGVVLEQMNKSSDGAPLPYRGIHWSIGHKSTCVAGVVAPAPVGIDIERIRPVDLALYDKIASLDEWRLGGEKDDDLFFRYWTAKETVLKASGSGLKALSSCCIDQVVDDCHLWLFHGNRKWLVEQFRLEGHLASVIKNDWQVHWHLHELP